jgi:hypothetical protein
MRHGTWNIRSLYRAASLRTVTRETAKYKSDLVEELEVIEMTLNQEAIIYFSVECGMRIMK